MDSKTPKKWSEFSKAEKIASKVGLTIIGLLIVSIIVGAINTTNSAKLGSSQSTDTSDQKLTEQSQPELKQAIVSEQKDDQTSSQEDTPQTLGQTTPESPPPPPSIKPQTFAQTTPPPPPPPPPDPEPVSSNNCDPNYTPCVPLVSYDLNCSDIGFKVRIIGSDPHGFDGNDNDGWGCESY